MSQEPLPARTQTLIIGSGIVGNSVAYHLAALGHTDVLVLDKGDLHHNDGSTSHAPGGVHVTSPSKMMTDFAVYSTELYENIEPFVKSEPCYRPVSGIELAISDSRMQELKRRHGIATAFGVKSELISPSKCNELLPLLDPESVLGGFWVHRDCNVGGSHMSSALARDAQAKGIQFRGDCRAEKLLLDGHKVVGVKTAEGEVYADRVLVATNIWAPLLSNQVGLELPLMAAQHQYVVTEPVPELAEFKGREIVLPTLREQDSAVYYRHHGDCWGIGNYRHEPLLVAAKDVGKTAMRPFTEQHFRKAWESSCRLFPCLTGLKLERSFNGMFAFTLDGMPFLGPTKIDGLWTAVGVWLTHAGGVGKAAAEWIVNGAPSTDCREANVNRVHDFQTKPGYIYRRSYKNYAEVYDIHHPMEPLSEPRGVRHTPVHHRMEQLGAHFVESGGWEMPKWYESNRSLLDKYQSQIPQRDEWSARHWSPIQGAEHLAVRETAGLFNIGALGVVEISGSSATDYLQNLCTNDMEKPPGRLIYTLMLNQLGGVRADLTVARWRDCYWVINGGAILPRELWWLMHHAPQDGSVNIRDLSSSLTTFGLWGPKAREILQSISPNDLSNDNFKFYRCQDITVADIPVKALRLSYAGELGWELYTKTEYGLALWDAIWEAGEPLGMIPAGGGAFDSLRLEKGYRLWGTDVTTEHSPNEVGLEFVVRNKPHIGCNAKRTHRSDLLCLTLKEPGALLGGEPVFQEGQHVGYVTSANCGYSVGQFLALAHIRSGAHKDKHFEVEYLGQRLRADVVSDPVFDPEMKRLRS